MVFRTLPLVLIASAIGFGTSEARMICTIVTDASSNRIMVEQGDCGTRVTPASTFKIALSVMGYDARFLKDEHTPLLAFKKGYPDYGGKAWKQPTDPMGWLEYSVVWYSQQIARAGGLSVEPRQSQPAGEPQGHGHDGKRGGRNADHRWLERA